MRDPERISRILKKIEKIWTQHPDLRLCQMLANCWPRSYDIYYKEDEELETLLDRTYQDVIK